MPSFFKDGDFPGGIERRRLLGGKKGSSCHHGCICRGMYLDATPSWHDRRDFRHHPFNLVSRSVCGCWPASLASDIRRAGPPGKIRTFISCHPRRIPKRPRMVKSTQQQAEIAELIRRSETARLQLSDAHAALKDKLNVPARLKESLKAEPKKWMGGSLVAGLLFSRMFRSRKPQQEKVQQVRKQRNILLGALALLVSLAKPAAKIYATNLLREYFQRKLGRDVSLHHGNTPRY